MADSDHIPASFDRLLLAFTKLESYGIETRIIPGTDSAFELARLRDSIRQKFPLGTASCVFLLRRDIDCFDSAGDLRRPVPLHHSGDDVIKAMKSAFREVDLSVVGHLGPSTASIADLSLAHSAERSFDSASFGI